MATLNARQTLILERVRDQGRVLVDDLARRHETTPQTIRRDLQILTDTGEVMRFHGGAMLLAGTEYTDFELRKAIASDQKEAIGRVIGERIPNNTLLMINAGTTTAAVARALRHHAGLKIVSDNVSIANELRAFSGVEVMVPGGIVRRSDGAILGEATVEFIRQFNADIAVIGAAAIDMSGYLLDFDLREVHVARAIIENAKHVFLAADSSKFGRSAPIKIGHLAQVQTIVCDPEIDDEVRRLCTRFGVDLVETRVCS